MPKFARSDEPKANQVQMKSKIQVTEKRFGIQSFVIDLAFEL